MPVKVNLVRALGFSRRVLRDFFFRNNGLMLTSAVAYNALLSLIPLATVLLVFFSQFFNDKLLMEAMMTEVALISPKAAPMLEEVMQSFLEKRQLAGWIGVGVLLFFSSMAFRVLENAFAIIFNRRLAGLKRRFWISALMPYLFIGLLAVGLIVITAITAVVESAGTDTLGLGGVNVGLQWLAGLGLHFAGFVGLVLLFTAIYKVLPVTKIPYKIALTGGVTAAVLWELLRVSLVSYFTHLSLVNAVYGSMATTIILLLTMEAAALIVLLGAQVIAELQRSLRDGTPWYEDPDGE